MYTRLQGTKIRKSCTKIHLSCARSNYVIKQLGRLLAKRKSTFRYTHHSYERQKKDISLLVAFSHFKLSLSQSVNFPKFEGSHMETLRG